MLPFHVVCGALTAVACWVIFRNRSTLPKVSDERFQEFQRSYLLVYLMAMGGDWLQGPYVYALYQEYGFSSQEISQLFVAGFGASLLLGTVVGSFADKVGRRLNCILYAVLYMGSCLTKHFNNYRVLMLGRFLGGVATSLLYSAFEAWMVSEHKKNGFDDAWIAGTFAKSVLGNSVVAVLAGFVANAAAQHFGKVAPFDIAFVLLGIMAAYTATRWNENYGDTAVPSSQVMTKGLQAVRSNRRVLFLGLIQSLFEGSMYMFVLLWTPALQSVPNEQLPFGWIFASFMISVMLGSEVFKIANTRLPVEKFMVGVFLLAGVCLACPVLLSGQQGPIMLAFCTFEVCVGIFWPAMGTLRSRYVEEEVRSTVMNIFRIPLNLIVVVILLQNFAEAETFTICTFFLALAAVLQMGLVREVGGAQTLP